MFYLVIDRDKKYYLINTGLFIIFSILFTIYLWFIGSVDTILISYLIIIIVFFSLYLRAFFKSNLDNGFFKTSFILNYIIIFFLVLIAGFVSPMNQQSLNEGGPGAGLIGIGLLYIAGFFILLSFITFLIGMFRSKNLRDPSRYQTKSIIYPIIIFIVLFLLLQRLRLSSGWLSLGISFIVSLVVYFLIKD